MSASGAALTAISPKSLLKKSPENNILALLPTSECLKQAEYDQDTIAKGRAMISGDNREKWFAKHPAMLFLIGHEKVSEEFVAGLTLAQAEFFCLYMINPSVLKALRVEILSLKVIFGDDPRYNLELLKPLMTGCGLRALLGGYLKLNWFIMHAWEEKQPIEYKYLLTPPCLRALERNDICTQDYVSVKATDRPSLEYLWTDLGFLAMNARNPQGEKCLSQEEFFSVPLNERYTFQYLLTEMGVRALKLGLMTVQDFLTIPAAKREKYSGLLTESGLQGMLDGQLTPKEYFDTVLSYSAPLTCESKDDDREIFAKKLLFFMKEIRNKFEDSMQPPRRAASKLSFFGSFTPQELFCADLSYLIIKLEKNSLSAKSSLRTLDILLKKHKEYFELARLLSQYDVKLNVDNSLEVAVAKFSIVAREPVISQATTKRVAVKSQ